MKKNVTKPLSPHHTNNQLSNISHIACKQHKALPAFNLILCVAKYPHHKGCHARGYYIQPPHISNLHWAQHSRETQYQNNIEYVAAYDVTNGQTSVEPQQCWLPTRASMCRMPLWLVLSRPPTLQAFVPRPMRHRQICRHQQPSMPSQLLETQCISTWPLAPTSLHCRSP